MQGGRHAWAESVSTLRTGLDYIITLIHQCPSTIVAVFGRCQGSAALQFSLTELQFSPLHFQLHYHFSSVPTSSYSILAQGRSRTCVGEGWTFRQQLQFSHCGGGTDT
jgi:hypothetical protein